MHKNSQSFFPSKKEIHKAINFFNGKQMILFILFILGVLASGFLILDSINQKFLIERPIVGGNLTEGSVGSPRFINPILATSTTDKDLSSLIFSGLMKKNLDGTLRTDLADSYTVSGDGLTYNFILKDNVFFHDETPVRSDDVMFTITQIQDSKIKSPLQSQWENISVKKIDDRTLEFKLTESYTSFLNNMTVGILPEHVWKNLDAEEFIFSETNLDAVGSGSYKISNIEQKKSGVINSILLKSTEVESSKEPYISKIKFIFYKNEEDLIKAFKSKKVDQISAINPESAEKLKLEGYEIKTTDLSRVFAVFLNKNKQELFRNAKIVEAIKLSIDKKRIINQVLYGYGTEANNPIPEHIYSNTSLPLQGEMSESVRKANEILDAEGWAKGSEGIRSKDGKALTFSISTGDALELVRTVEIIKEDLAKVGIRVETKIFEIGNLNQNIIRQRDYEALFFGQIIGNESDLFAFWHSSQRTDPGLNIGVYTNSKVDSYLEKILTETNKEEKNKYFKQIEEEISKDSPAIFIYSPDFIYLTSKKIKNIELGNLVIPSERFINIEDWYTRTEKVWKIFNKNN